MSIKVCFLVGLNIIQFIICLDVYFFFSHIILKIYVCFLQVLFVPFALRTQDDYASKARKPFVEWGFEFDSIHSSEDKVSAVKSAQAIFIG